MFINLESSGNSVQILVFKCSLQDLTWISKHIRTHSHFWRPLNTGSSWEVQEIQSPYANTRLSNTEPKANTPTSYVFLFESQWIYFIFTYWNVYTQNNWGLKISMQTRAYTPEIIWRIGTSLEETIWKNQGFLWWYSKFSSKINMLTYIEAI